MECDMEPLSLEQTVDINAPVETVWALIGDVRRMAEWSPQVDSVRLSDGATELGVGTKFTNLNHDGDQQWVTHAQIVEWEPPHRVAFKIIENWTIWSYECSPTPSGTRVVQRRVAPQGVNPLAQEYVEQNLGGSESFAAAVTQGARTTLDRLKAAAEAS
jgi:uncharacterized protein YndB with AHSA1/START domain